MVLFTDFGFPCWLFFRWSAWSSADRHQLSADTDAARLEGSGRQLLHLVFQPLQPGAESGVLDIGPVLPSRGHDGNEAAARFEQVASRKIYRPREYSACWRRLNVQCDYLVSRPRQKLEVFRVIPLVISNGMRRH